MRFLSLFVFALFSAGFVVHADEGKPLNTYTYRVRLAQTERSCAEEAAMLGQRFQSATGFEVVKAECVGSAEMRDSEGSHLLNILVVSYKAEYRANAFSAVIDPEAYWPLPLDNASSLYDTYSECAEDLSTQANFFEDNTGLVSVAAYCDPKNSGSPAYRLKIESFGTPKVRLFAFHGFRNFGEQANASVLEMIRKTGAVVTKEKSGEVFYYAAKPVNMSRESFGGFPNADHCTAQEGDAIKILQKLGAKEMILRCSPRAELSGVELQAVSDTNWFLSNDFGSRSPVYYSFQECMQDKPRYLEEKGETALGGICVQDFSSSGEAYRIDTYSRL